MSDSGDNLYDIKSKLAEDAVQMLQPALIDLYEVYGFDVTLAVLSFYLSRAIVYEEGLTDKERDAKLASTKFCLDLYCKYWREDKEEDEGLI